MGRWGKCIVIAAVLVILGTLALPIVYLVRYAGRSGEVRREIARIESEGMPASAADLAGKPIPDSENGAVLYEKAFKYLPAPGARHDQFMMRRFRSFHDNWEDPEMWRQVRTALARYSKALELAEQAAAKPKCRFRIEWAKPLDYSDSQYMHLRYLCRLATARAVMHAKDGNMDQAVESIKLILRMSESMKDEPSLASRMVRYGAIQNATDAVEAVALYGGIDETRARRLCELLAAVDLRDSAAKGLAGERAVGIVIYDRIRSGRMPKWASDRDPDDIVGRMRGILPSGWVLGSDEIYYLKQMRKQIDAAACPYRELAPRIRGAQPDPPRFAIVSAVIVPWGMRAISTRDRAIARLAGGRIFLGLVAYHSRYGAYPRTLEQLRSRLGWRVAPDPFSGKDFVYRRKGAGFLLYSLGEDLRDGGGLDARMGGMGDIVWTRDR